MDALVATNILH